MNKEGEMSLSKVLLLIILVVTSVTLVLLFLHDRGDVQQQPISDVEAASDIFDRNSGQKIGQSDSTGTNCKEVGSGNITCPGHPSTNVQVCVADATASCGGNTACVISQADSCLSALSSVDLASRSAGAGACGVLENLHSSRFNCCSTTGNVCGGIETAYQAAGCGALSCLELSGKVAFETREQSVQQDLNGDGDMFDRVLRYYDFSSNTVVNTGGVGYRPTLDGDYIAFTAREGEILQDLNGDGDTGDFMLQIYEISTSTLINTEVSGWVGAFGKAVDDNIFVLMTRETHIATDLNGDGDLNDEILRYYDVSTQTTVNTGLVSTSVMSIDSGHIAFTVYEGTAGEDLNGDGDTNDRVVRVYNLAFQTVDTIGLGDAPAIEGDIVTFQAREDLMDQDLNGDGDKTDTIIQFYSISLETLTNTSAIGFRPDIDGTTIVFESRESLVGIDLNNDGDLADTVIRYYDTFGGLLTNTGIGTDATKGGVSIDNGIIAFPTAERADDIDLNNDRDTSDVIIRAYDILSGQILNTKAIGEWVSLDITP